MEDLYVSQQATPELSFAGKKICAPRRKYRSRQIPRDKNHPARALNLQLFCVRQSLDESPLKRSIMFQSGGS